MGDNLLDEIQSCQVYEPREMLLNSFCKLFEFYKSDILCDVVLCAGKKEIKCHRVVLASCSPYFQAMFTCPLTESQESCITIRDIEESTLEVLVDFAYTAKIELNVTNAQSILHASSVLQMNALTQACCNFMCTQFHPSNCLEIRQFAERHGLFSLVDEADDYAKLHFQELMSNEDFSDIDAQHLLKLISDDNLCVDSEEQVFHAMLLWMKTDGSKKSDYFPKLLSKVRLPFLSKFSHSWMALESNEFIRNSLECRDLLDEARNYMLWYASHSPSVSLPVNERTRPRKSYAGALFCIGGRGSSGNPFASTECYSWFHDKWFELKDMSTSRRHVGCTSANGKIYAFGGCNEKEHLSSGEVFDPVTCQWVSLSPMSTRRRGFGLCQCGDPIYAVGGLDNTVFYSVVERYDMSSDMWTNVASMNTSRGGVAVVEFKGYLYAFGGNCGPVSLKTCEKYNPYLDKWTFICSMDQCRAGAGAVVLDEFIYVLGGFDNNVPLSSVERYCPQTDSWNFVAQMNMSRGGVGVAELGKKIYAIGGHSGTSYLKTVEVYDAEIDKWNFTTGIAQCRAGAGVTWCPCPKTVLDKLNNASLAKKE